MIVSREITISGIVQGVGFRPYIYRLARLHAIRGGVKNDTRGVQIIAEGDERDVDSFIDAISAEPPPLAFIESLCVAAKEPIGADRFVIEQSREALERTAFIAPDTALCDDCLYELLSVKDRRYQYPFITCTNCGPRFSIVRDIPYDRKNTSMAGFTMCVACSREYADPDDRRFHTQPDTCGECGPAMVFMSASGEVLERAIDRVTQRTVDALRDGAIVAIKGVGGYLLACDAKNDAAVAILRSRKGRPFKPFALMAGSMKRIESFLHVSPVERELLCSRERPIVLLKIKNREVCEGIAPGLSDIGIMLPYAPFQHLLFKEDPDMLQVMTSGNISDEPIVFRDGEAIERLGRIADYFVSYNRAIVAFSDDSVRFVQDEIPCFIRRSRGYVPVPFKSSVVPESILATGGDLKNSFAFSRDGVIILSQFVGDLSTLAGNDVYTETIAHLGRIYAFTPETVISDLHPGYFTTQFADSLEETGLGRLKAQHHHAHIVSVLEDAGREGPVLGIAFDGTGYGTDGKLWGSEFLVADRTHFTRMAHFSYFPLPGGESAIRDVWKIGTALLNDAFGPGHELMRRGREAESVLEIIGKNINSPLTCSIGRLCDGMSSILGIRDRVTAEAEAAQLLEEAALRGSRNARDDGFIIPMHGDGEIEISTTGLVRYCEGLLKRGYSTDETAYRFHAAIVRTTVALAESLRERTGINAVALSGGAFQNRLLLGLSMRGLREKKFDILIPRKIPFNDGCLAVGQVAIAKEILK